MCFLEGSTISRGKYYNKVVKLVNDLTPLYLPAAGKQASDVGVDVVQDIFSLEQTEQGVHGSSHVVETHGRAKEFSNPVTDGKGIPGNPGYLGLFRKDMESQRQELSAKTARLKPNVTSATMFVAENAEVLRKHYKQIVKTVNILTPLYLSEAGKQVSPAGVDVHQDLFSLRHVFDSCPRCFVSYQQLNSYLMNCIKTH